MATELRTLLDTIADAIAEDPCEAGVAFAADCELVGPCEVDVRVGGHRITVDEPEMLGGGGVAPNPVQYALAALGSCNAITYRFWAAKLGMRLDTVRVDVTGDLDVRGVFGLDERVRPGYAKVEMLVTLGGPEGPASYEMLAKIVDEHTPVLDLFANPTPVHRELRLV